jgi:hypothetical protein
MAPPRPPIRRPCPDPSLIEPATGATSWCAGCQKAVRNLDHMEDDAVRALLDVGGACVRYRPMVSVRAAALVITLATATESADARPPKTASVDDVTQQAPTGTLVATVTDDDGLEFPGVTVQVEPASRDRRAARALRQTTTTDDSGRAVFVLGVGEWELVASARGYTTSVVTQIHIVRSRTIPLVVGLQLGYVE